MEKIKFIRRGHRSVVTRLINKTNERFETGPSAREIRTAIDSLETKQELFKTLDNQIIDVTEVDDIEQELLDTDDFNYNLESTIRRYKEKLEEGNPTQRLVSEITHSPPNSISALNHNSNQANHESDTDHFTSQPSTSASSSATPSSNFYHRLPKLDLPKFNGDVMSWTTFWDSYYTTIHTNPSLANVQKFSYLRSQLSHSAEQCISGLALSSANYEQAICLLKERYGDEQHIVDAYMKNLLDLPSPAFTSHSLRSFYDSMESSIRGLESLGQSQDSFGSLLIPIILKKLPIVMRKNMTREHGKKSWNIHSLREAISKEMYVEETNSNDNSTELTPTASFVTGAMSKSGKSNRRFNNNHTQSKVPPREINKKPCVYCNGTHHPSECVAYDTAEKRSARIKQKMLCFNCFGNHKVTDCRSKYSCRKCKRRHHTTLCDCTENKEHSTTTKAAVIAVNGEEQLPTTALYTTQDRLTSSRTDVLLKTAVSTVSYGKHATEANILLDEGSQKSFVTEDLAQRLNLKPCGTTTISLAAFGDASRNVRNLQKAIVNLQTENHETLSMEVLIVPTIAAPLTNRTRLEVGKMPYLRGLKLAHPIKEEDNFEISMLIGADFYWDIVENEIIRGNGPTAVKSKLGYLLSGPTFNQNVSTTCISTTMMNVLIQHKQEEVDLEKFWNLESIGVTEKEMSTKENSFYDTYESSIEHENGRYIAKLPWKDDFDDLPSNYQITKIRTEIMISKLRKDPDVMKVYGEIMADQQKRGFIEKIDENEQSDNKVHYIPHHGVKKNSSTTPIRIVFDCSCRESSGKASLNDCLQSVPPAMNDLTGILTRFRLKEYAVTTDIEKAFLQIELHKDDRDATRFLWYDDPCDPSSPLVTYRFRVVLFGATCSPFILHATILKHLKTNDTRFTETLKDGLYVDNILTSFESEDELMSFYKESRQLFNDGGFNLRSWSSNSNELCQLASNENCVDTDRTIKILGLRWNNESDTISFQDNFNPDLKNTCLTKRELLQQSSKIFDPLGLVSPVSVRAKLLMQILWKEKYEWDQPLPDEIKNKWIDIVQELRKVTTLEIPRYYFSDTMNIDPKTVLHVFTDSSLVAYASCAYIVRGEQSSLVMSRNRVAPMKAITLPRMELMGAVLGSRLAKHLQENLGIKDIIFWCDSQIVLNWITSSKPQKKFISNRVREIKENIQTQQWRYCPTDSNPADLLTRGTTADKVQNTFWMNGPEWLTVKSKWPEWSGNVESIVCTSEEDDNLESAHSVATITTEETGIHKLIDLKNVSRLQKLLRITAYAYRFIKNCRVKSEFRTRTTLTADEIHNAMTTWITNTQEHSFRNQLTDVSKHSSIVRQLRLYKDNDKTIRCGGRLANAPLCDSAKFPYLLPTKHRFTTLVIQDAHQRQLHAGVNSTVTYLRQTFWIPRIRQSVRSTLKKCVICRKVTSKPYQKPDPPPLPKGRVNDDIPFSVCGVDFAGPLHVKNTDKTKSKVYICLYTCASTRAVHLELVPNLSVESFMLGFRRFTSRHSVPRTLISDNALTFIAASKDIQTLTKSAVIHDQFNSRGTTWKFIAKRAPWFGGFYERLIGLTKQCLRKVLGNACVDTETLRTILYEVESTVNDRPLTYLSTDSSDPNPISPSQLLYGRRINVLPYPNDSSENVKCEQSKETVNTNFARQCKLVEHFRNRWKLEYLTSLREYHRATGNNKNQIKIGEIVQIHDETHRNQWKLGIVDKLLTGEDNIVRSVQLKTARGNTNRPIAKLYPLEVSTTETTLDEQRPSRASKTAAMAKIHKWTS